MMKWLFAPENVCLGEKWLRLNYASYLIKQDKCGMVSILTETILAGTSTERIRVAIASGLDIKRPMPSEIGILTPFAAAILSCSEPMVNMMAESGARFDAQDVVWTPPKPKQRMRFKVPLYVPVIAAARAMAGPNPTGGRRMMEISLENGADINHLTKYGEGHTTALTVYLWHMNLDTEEAVRLANANVAFLLNLGAKPPLEHHMLMGLYTPWFAAFERDIWPSCFHMVLSASKRKERTALNKTTYTAVHNPNVDLYPYRNLDALFEEVKYDGVYSILEQLCRAGCMDMYIENFIKFQYFYFSELGSALYLHWTQLTKLIVANTTDKTVLSACLQLLLVGQSTKMICFIPPDPRALFFDVQEMLLGLGANINLVYIPTGLNNLSPSNSPNVFAAIIKMIIVEKRFPGTLYHRVMPLITWLLDHGADPMASFEGPGWESAWHMTASEAASSDWRFYDLKDFIMILVVMCASRYRKNLRESFKGYIS